jgi:hypothetical protein
VNVKDWSYENVLARLEAGTIARLSGEDEANLLLFGTNRALLEAAAEEISDAAMYDEHLTREAVWDTAQGYSSIMKQVSFWNYKPHSRIGSTGKIRVSASETFDGEYPYNITIPQWTAFSGGGLSFLSRKQASLPSGTKYIDIDIVQGKLKTKNILITEALFPQPKGTAYARLTVDDPNIENYNFEVRVNGVLWQEAEHIRLARTKDDRVYTRENMTAYKGVILGFGNNMFGKALEYGDVVSITYIDIEGKNGNVFASGIVTAVDDVIRDELGETVELFCTNLSAISGGGDYEPLDEIRARAPQAYQTSNRAITSKDYQFLIEGGNFVDRAYVWGEKEINEDLGNKPGTFIPATQNLIYITGFLIDPDTRTGVSMPESAKDRIREFLNDKKGTTDILQFVDTQFVYLNFRIRAFISDYRYTPEQIRAFIRQRLADVYQARTAEYRRNLYFSDYYAVVDGIEGIDHHITTFSLSETFRFDSAYEFTANINLEMIKRGSVSIKVRSVANDMPWTPVAQDDGYGNITGLPVDPENPGGERYQLPSVFITYTSGKIGKIVITNGLEYPHTSYDIRIDFELDDVQAGDILLTKRQQIIAYYSEQITVEYMG